MLIFDIFQLPALCDVLNTNACRASSVSLSVSACVSIWLYVSSAEPLDEL
jgi:hypothetical protein